MKTIFLIPVVFVALARPGFSESLFTQKGTDPSFADVMKGGKLPKGRTSTSGVTGSVVNVSHELVETTRNSRRPIPRAIRIHTLGNSSILRKDFGKWSRWYQEDGSTQVFRLFTGEVNLRNSREYAARVEAFSDVKWEHGAWHEWSGTYTIIKPHGAAILQVKNRINDWAVQLNMNADGNILLNHRRGKDKQIATDMVGKPFHIRVRDNGRDYEVFMDGKKVGTGSYARPEGTTAFRWGMYLGKNEVRNDAMIFVSGATVDGG